MPRPYDNSVANFISNFSPCQEAQDNWAATGGRANMVAVWNQSKQGKWLEWVLNRFGESTPNTQSFRDLKQQHSTAIFNARVDYKKALAANAPNVASKLAAIRAAENAWAKALRAEVSNPFV